MKPVLALPLLLAVLPALAAQVYQYQDAQGRTVYSDVPPPGQAASSKRVGGAGSGPLPLPFATEQAAKAFPVTLYAGNCGELCDKARALLAGRGVPFAAVDPTGSRSGYEALLKLGAGSAVPVLTVGSRVQAGFDERGWHAALDGAGYPKAGSGAAALAVRALQGR